MSRNSSQRRGRHRMVESFDVEVAPESGVSRKMMVSSAALGAAMILSSIGVGAAAAAEQGGVTPPSSQGPSQGGVSPDNTAPSQGGVTPEVVPPSRAPSILPPVTFDSPPVYDDPGVTTAPVVYSAPYTPNPLVVFQAPTRKAPPRQAVLPRPGKLKFGETVIAQPDWLADADARRINEYAEKVNIDVAKFLIERGVPEDEATRQAAATTLGVAIGGVGGALAVGIPAAVIGTAGGALAGAGIGAIIGSFVPPQPLNIGTGALIGLGSGAAAGGLGLGAAGAAVGGITGGVIGGLLGYTFGAGDPGADPKAPLAPGERERGLSKPPPPNPEANQYQLHADGLPGGGTVNYVVDKSGNVDGNINVGPASVPLKWSAAQADAPIKAAGFLAQTARDDIAATVKNVSDQAEKLFPGVRIDFPQLTPAAKTPVKK